MSIPLVLILVSFPFFAATLLMKMFGNLAIPMIKIRIDSLYENVDLQKRTALFYSVLFLARRLSYALILIFAQDFPAF